MWIEFSLLGSKAFDCLSRMLYCLYRVLSGSKLIVLVDKHVFSDYLSHLGILMVTSYLLNKHVKERMSFISSACVQMSNMAIKLKCISIS